MAIPADSRSGCGIYSGLCLKWLCNLVKKCQLESFSNKGRFKMLRRGFVSVFIRHLVSKAKHLWGNSFCRDANLMLSSFFGCFLHLLPAIQKQWKVHKLQRQQRLNEPHRCHGRCIGQQDSQSREPRNIWKGEGRQDLQPACKRLCASDVLQCCCCCCCLLCLLPARLQKLVGEFVLIFRREIWKI